MSEIDYSSLNSNLLSMGPDLLISWGLHGGKRRGGEFVVAGLGGGVGDSLSINTRTGVWCDFATGAKGRDLISLYATMRGMTNPAAYTELGGVVRSAVSIAPLPNVRQVLGPPPEGTAPAVDGPNVWHYRDAHGKLLFSISRNDSPTGKSFLPWSWDIHATRWVNKSWPSPRPLYGLVQLSSRPDAPVLICEGEKSCDAASKLATAYVCVTWPNGAASVNNADWSVLAGRKILIWPDNDLAGVTAREALIARLQRHVPEIKYLNVDDMPAKWDAADWDRDLLGTGWSDWARPRVVTVPAVITPPTATVTLTEDHAPLPESVAVLCERYGLAVRGRSGVPLTNADNVLRVMTNVPGYQGLVWFDEFYGEMRTALPTGWGLTALPPVDASPMAGRSWTDADSNSLLIRLQRAIGFQSLGMDALMAGLSAYAHCDVRNEPRDWMLSLRWDGTPRLNKWLTEALGVVSGPYTEAVASNFMVSLVARTLSPGCQVDTMLVFEGVQGSGKSSFFNILAGKWYAEASESINSKDFFMVFRGKLIVEIAELDAFGKADVTRIKQILSCRTDRYREPYGRLTQDWPRRSVMVGTTNDSEYLKDATGARRFWPVEVHSISLDWLRANRDQLFAEAVAAYQQGVTWYEVPADEHAEMADSKRVHDGWEDMVMPYLNDTPLLDGVTLLTIWTQCLNGNIQSYDRMVQLRLAKILAGHGWKKVKKRVGKDTKWVYFPPLPVEPPF